MDLSSFFYTVRAAIPYLTEQKSGKIINISSFVGQAGNFGQANYSAAKAGIIGFTKTAALELARAIRYLIVDGDYITGQTLSINGGIYM